MKLLIDIPKEFEQHFQKDGFNDSLMRLSMDANCLAGLYEQETALMLCEAFRNAILVPAHGDLIDASTKVTIQIYDDMYEDFHDEECTIADVLDRWSNEGCPEAIIPAEKDGEGNA